LNFRTTCRQQIPEFRSQNGFIFAVPDAFRNNGNNGHMNWVKYLKVAVTIAILCFVSLAVTYGYEEGTLQNHLIGGTFAIIFSILKFPLVYLLPSRYLIFSLLVNVVLWTIMVVNLDTILARK